ncbi:kelch repeat-containing protein [Pendulispora albinea]|uniref:Galactose oxidase n=1 Tax=Pendulispora albinea TaxID=2741071 RepID=A0ABZ2MAU1_9BACT
MGDTWLFDGSSWVAFQGAGPPRRSDSPAMATLRGKAVLFGGAIRAEGGPIIGPDGGRFHTEIADDTWVFDGIVWIHVAAKPAPPGRDSAVMSTLDGKLVLFGGQDRNAAPPAFVDTWTFDLAGFATGWIKQTTSAWPVSPVSASMAPLQGKLVLFGGSSDAPQGSTWIYDGASWAKLDVSGPPGRFGASMAALENRLVLFGGFDKSAFKNLDDTWTFDGTTWARVEGPGPSARTHAVMAPLNGKLVLFGGFDGRDQNDTWTFDGKRWAKHDVPGPPGRWCAAMTGIQPPVAASAGSARAATR